MAVFVQSCRRLRFWERESPYRARGRHRLMQIIASPTVRSRHLGTLLLLDRATRAFRQCLSACATQKAK